MKKISNTNTLNILNYATGFLLITSGIYYFIKTNTFDMALSWIIFGAMYLVMESYNCECRQPRRIIIFSWLGFLLSLSLFVYYIFNL